jgi:hypothetical protein
MKLCLFNYFYWEYVIVFFHRHLRNIAFLISAIAFFGTDPLWYLLKMLIGKSTMISQACEFCCKVPFSNTINTAGVSSFVNSSR